jgi:NTP pyrophosphatase (non-canonical NTP hydrolase)|tara:strand:+ start:1154 stop:1414 length:261 start_codon:yes stop_codon:yes gene_type:complete
MINKKLDYDTELMVITMEECGELIEACSKTIRCENYKDDERMIEEVGDVLFMIDLMMKRGLIKKEDIDARKVVKREKLKKWSNLIQ